MAVAASDRALVHFGQQPLAPARVLYPSNGISLDLRVDVIEVEHGGIRLAAIDTWVICKKGIDHGSVR
jgi:hypothetical protein